MEGPPTPWPSTKRHRTAEALPEGRGSGRSRRHPGRRRRALLELRPRLGPPVVVGPKAKGVFDEDHPLFTEVIEALGTKVLLPR